MGREAAAATAFRRATAEQRKGLEAIIASQSRQTEGGPLSEYVDVQARGSAKLRRLNGRRLRGSRDQDSVDILVALRQARRSVESRLGRRLMREPLLPNDAFLRLPTSTVT